MEKNPNEAASVCAHSYQLSSLLAVVKNTQIKEKLELLQSFLNTGLHFSVDHLVCAVKNR